MIVCNCNGISEREVKAAIRNGANRWEDVHAYYGFTPSCGKCEPEIAGAIATHRVRSRPNDLPCPEAMAP